MEFAIFWGLIMRIDDSNGKLLDSKDFNFHDDILDQLLFNRDKQEMNLFIIKEEYKNKKYIIRFCGVIGFEMTSCDFWGKSPHILDFEYIEHNSRIVIPKLYNIKNNSQINPMCKLTDDSKYIETTITFASGDKLIVACEYIALEN